MGFSIKLPKLADVAKAVAPVYMGVGGQALKFGQGLAGQAGVPMPGGQPGQTGVSASGAPQFAMRNTSEFMKDTPADQIKRVQLGDSAMGGAAARRYASMKEQMGQQANAAHDQANQDLTRKFAAMGSAGSGAHIKLQQQADQQGEEQRQRSMNELNIAEETETAQRDDARQMAQAQMDQQLNIAQADTNFKQKVFNFESGSKLHELDMAERQQQIDANSTEFNKRMAEQMAKPPKQGLFSSLFDGIL